jgi:seryl-tRNA synthetase
VEQFLLTKPEDSWKSFDEMLATSEEFYKSLGLPYQVVGIVSGALSRFHKTSIVDLQITDMT